MRSMGVEWQNIKYTLYVVAEACLTNFRKRKKVLTTIKSISSIKCSPNFILSEYFWFYLYAKISIIIQIIAYSGGKKPLQSNSKANRSISSDVEHSYTYSKVK